MNPIIGHDLMQARITELYRQAHRDAQAQAASQAHRTRTTQRRHRVRGLTVVMARRAHRAGRHRITGAAGQAHPSAGRAHLMPVSIPRPAGRSPAAGTHHTTAPQEVVMNRIRRIAAVLAGLAATVAAFAATGPAAFAVQVPAPGQLGTHPAYHAAASPVVAGGMAGWQITLIAAAAALLAAVLAVLLDRAFAARRRTTANA